MFYSVCAPALLPKLKLDEAVRRIAQAGGTAYEFWGWGDNDADKVLAAQRETGVKAAAMCASFEPLNMPECHAAYIEETRQLISIANRLGIRTLITQVGRALAGTERQLQHAAIVAGLKKCVPVLEDNGITLTVEPLNIRVDHPGYYLSTSDEGFDIVDEVASPNVKLLFDVYHQQITEGDIISRLTGNVSKVGHIHIAGNPGRHEPYENSELNYSYVIERLKAAGYTGAVGLEYMPLREPVDSLRRLFGLMPEL